MKEKKARNKRIEKCVFACGLAVFVLISAILGTSVLQGAVTEKTELSNPIIEKASSMEAGQKVTWDCVWFGSYPQKEVLSTDAEYTVLTTLTDVEWNANGDANLNGKMYRRIKKSDATLTVDGKDSYYSWSDETTYHYFRYEPIKWRVLNVGETQLLLLSDVALDAQKYSTTVENITWKKSDIRSWLNGYAATENKAGVDYSADNFISVAFSETQQAKIADTTVVNRDNFTYGRNGGADTTDKLFLLSESEVYTGSAKTYGFLSNLLSNDEGRQSKCSDYAKAMGVWSYTNTGYVDNCNWLLRSPGGENSVAYTNCYGYVDNLGCYVHDGGNGVRVALNMKAAEFDMSFYAGTVCSDGTVSEIEPDESEEVTTTEKKTTEKTTTEKQTTEKQTTEKQTTEKPTTEKPTTEKQTTENPSTEEQTTQEQTTIVLPTKKASLDSSFTAKITYPLGDKVLSIYSESGVYNVKLYTKSTSPAQQWKFEKQSDGTYKITNLKYKQCLTVEGNSSADEANVLLADDDGGKGQRWTILQASTGKYVLRPSCASSTTAVLDVYGGETEVGTNVWIYTYNGTDAQHFSLEIVDQETTSEDTTENTSTEKQTTEKKTTVKPTTEKKTTQKVTVEDASTEKQTTEEQTTEKKTTAKPTTEKKTTQKVTVEDTSTEKQTTEKQTTEKKTTVKPTTEKKTTQKVTVEDASTEKQTTEKQTTEKQTTEKKTTQKATTEDTSTEEATTEGKSEEETTSNEETTSPVVNAKVPKIEQEPTDRMYSYGNRAYTMKYKVSVSDGGTLSYQWYGMNTRTGTPKKIQGATMKEYRPSTTTVGVKFYYCEITNTNLNATGNKIARVKTRTVKITVQKAYNRITGVNSFYGKTMKQGSFILNAQARGSLYFASSNKKVVTVDARSGKVTINGVGSAYITIKAGSTYYRNVEKRIRIRVNPRKQSIVSLKSPSKKALSLKWNQHTGITGYKIKYAMNKDFRGAKYVTVTGSSCNSKTIYGLTSGKTYYVMIRTYKRINNRDYMGEWSSVKTCKIR